MHGHDKSFSSINVDVTDIEALKAANIGSQEQVPYVIMMEVCGVNIDRVSSAE